MNDSTLQKSNKSMRYRIYPDEFQTKLFEKTFGCVRFVYNQLIEKQESLYTSERKFMSKFDMNNYINQSLKHSYSWLNEVDKNSLTYSAFALHKAYKAFFNHISNKPKFKSKHQSRKSYTTCFTNNNIEIGDCWIKLPKVKKVCAKVHRKPNQDWKIIGATISRECDGKYYCSILYKYATQTAAISNNALTLTSTDSIGLDYCVNGLFVDSNGNYCDNHPYSKKTYEKLAKEQHRLSRKIGSKKGEQKSSNYIKQLLKVKRTYRKIAHQLNDHLHKISNEIANRYDVVCVEDLDLAELKKQHMGMKSFNGKKPINNGYGIFTRYLSYKLEERGKYLIKVDRWFPSSKICSNCGNVKPMPIKIRTYCCPVCRISLDRDINAAINIRNEGVRILRKSV